jgi:hypothetical protein
MPNVSRLIAPKRILRYIRCVVPDSFKGATDKDEIQVTGYVFRVCAGPGHKLFTDVGRQRVQLLIAGFERPRERAIAFGKGSNAIAKNCERHPIRRLEQSDFAQQRPGTQTFRSSANGNRLVIDPLQVCADFIADTTCLRSEATG